MSERKESRTKPQPGIRPGGGPGGGPGGHLARTKERAKDTRGTLLRIWGVPKVPEMGFDRHGGAGSCQLRTGAHGTVPDRESD